MPTSKHGLGRGLGALIPPKQQSSAPHDSPAQGIRQIPIAHIEPNPFQPRKNFSPEALDELAASIREHGLIQPLLVREISTPQGTRYQLIAGERRWRAAQRAGLANVPAMIKGVTPQEALELALVENVQRADLNILEEAEAYNQLIEEFHLTHDQVAKRVGKTRATIGNALRLLKMPDPLKQAVLNETITEGHARALMQIAEPKKQNALLHKVIQSQLSVRDTEELVRRAAAKQPSSQTKFQATADSPFAARPPAIVRRLINLENETIEENLRRALATQVKLQRSERGGKLIIEFYSDEELDALYKKLMH